MSKIKKVLAMLLALAMVLGTTLTAFAASDNWRITITGTGIDQDAVVNYGQIIEEDRESTLGWKFVDGIADEFVNGWNSVDQTNLTEDDVIQAMIAANMIENPANLHVEQGTINPSENLAAALARVTNAAVTPMVMESGKWTADVSNSGKGLYIIIADHEGFTYLPMAVYMNSNGDNVAAVAKGSTDQIRKTIDDSGKSVAPGDEVPYIIEEEYLYINPNAEPKTFTITDTLTNGTFKGDSVKVFIKDSATATEETELVSDKDYTIGDYANKTTFTVDFGAKYNSSYAGKTVVIKYIAIVGDNVTSENVLSNAATSSNGTGKIVEVKPVSFTVTKLDGENNQLKLEGAEFQIYKEANQNDEDAVKLTLDDKSTVYGIPVGSVLTTGAEGTATINNLDAQITYYVKETKAPNGYSLNDTAYKLTGAVSKSDETESTTVGNVTYVKVTHSFENFNGQTVKDTKLSSLPSTGGIGTTIFTIGGCLIMIVAAGLFFASRRKSAK